MTGTTIVAPGTLLCVGAGAAPALVESARRLVRRGSPLSTVVSELTSGGVVTAPDFLCAAVEGDVVRLLVRGEYQAIVVRANGVEERVHGAGSLTWMETLIAGAVAVQVFRPGAADLDWVVRIDATAFGDPLGPEVAEAIPSENAPRRSRTGAVAPVAARPDPGDAEPEEEPASAPSFDFSNLLEHTRYRDVESAAVRVALGPEDDEEMTPELEAEADGSQSHDDTTVLPHEAPVEQPLISVIPAQELVADGRGALGDHDGHTVSAAAVSQMVDRVLAGDASVSATVQAVACTAGHPNPPTVDLCRRCRAPVADRTVRTIPRPVVAQLRFDTGTVLQLDRPYVLGRRPSIDGVSLPGGEIPRLHGISSPDSDISRIHALIRLEGWDVLIEDFASTNGTEVRLPGQELQRIRERDPVLLVPGTEVVLAGVVSFRVEVPA